MVARIMPVHMPDRPFLLIVAVVRVAAGTMVRCNDKMARRFGLEQRDRIVTDDRHRCRDKQSERGQA